MITKSEGCWGKSTDWGLKKIHGKRVSPARGAEEKSRGAEKRMGWEARNYKT